MNKKIGIIDCNNFYVSCERVFNPISVGRPTVVLSNNDGSIIARSSEAKDLGIKMGEPFFQRKDFMDEHKFCVYSSNYNLYGDMSDRVMNVIKKYGKTIEIYSIDECFVDFSDIDDSILLDVLKDIRDDVKKQTGIPVSIGVGPNKTLAKLTSKIAKKQISYNGVCSFWDMNNLNVKINEISIDEVWGIGRSWSKKLKNLNVSNVGEFLTLNDKVVKKIMNVNGLKTFMELKGFYCHEITTNQKLKKNIASTRSFGQDIDCFNQISEAMYSYIQNGVTKLKGNEVIPNKVTIFLCGNYHKNQKHYKSRQIQLSSQTNNVNEIWSQVYVHLQDLYDESKKYKKCGITFNELVPVGYEQTKLFVDESIDVPVPNNTEKLWEMNQDFLSQKYTTSWDEIPKVFV